MARSAERKIQGFFFSPSLVFVTLALCIDFCSFCLGVFLIWGGYSHYFFIIKKVRQTFDSHECVQQAKARTGPNFHPYFKQSWSPEQKQAHVTRPTNLIMDFYKLFFQGVWRNSFFLVEEMEAFQGKVALYVDGKAITFVDDTNLWLIAAVKKWSKKVCSSQGHRKGNR